MKIKQHRPAYFDFPNEIVEFNTLDELLNIEFVKNFSKASGFYKYSVSEDMLMAEYDEGTKWYVVGISYDLNKLGLPEWDQEKLHGLNYNKLMLLEIAIGDAYGCCYEWTERWIIKSKNKLEYLTLQENPSVIPPGNYTDDTQMTLAIAELLLEEKEKWDHYILADKFVECFHRDPRRGYAPGFYLFLLDHKNGVDFVHDIRSNSTRSGAAMRAGPLGLIPDINELREKCDIQSTLTHNTVQGRNSSLCAALAVHYFRYNLGDKKDLGNYLGDVFNDFDLSGLKEYDHIPVEGWPCVWAAMSSIMQNDTLTGVLKSCIDFAGDTDTIAAIAMAVASQSKEIAQDLPENLFNGLENGTYGRDYIIKLDEQLEKLYGVKQ